MQAIADATDCGGTDTDSSKDFKARMASLSAEKVTLQAKNESLQDEVSALGSVYTIH